jgi:hypothetical protein
MSDLVATDITEGVPAQVVSWPSGSGAGLGDAVVEGSCVALDGQCLGSGCGPDVAPENRYHQTVERNISIDDPHLEPFMGFHLAQFEDDEPYVAFVADGSWAELDEVATEQLIADVTAWLSDLTRSRAHLAAARITRLATGRAVDAAVARYAAAACPHSATPEQVGAWEFIKRTILDSPDPCAAAAEVRRLLPARSEQSAANAAAGSDRLPRWWPEGRLHPSWCDGDHDDDVEVEDRSCYGDNWRVILSLSDPGEGRLAHGQSGRITVSLSQHVQDGGPRLWVGLVGLDDSSQGRHLTPGEARHLAAALLQAVYCAGESR